MTFCVDFVDGKDLIELTDLKDKKGCMIMEFTSKNGEQDDPSYPLEETDCPKTTALACDT